MTSTMNNKVELPEDQVQLIGVLDRCELQVHLRLLRRGRSGRIRSRTRAQPSLSTRSELENRPPLLRIGSVQGGPGIMG